MPGHKCGCGSWKNWNAQRCWACGNQVRRIALLGVPHSAQRRWANSEGHKGDVNRFDLGAFTRGKPSPRAKPVGYTRVLKDKGRVQIKCADGKFRYRARVVWQEANGPIPPGHHIHHINHDRLDDRLENLQIITASDHGHQHVPPGEAGKRLSASGHAARYGKKESA